MIAIIDYQLSNLFSVKHAFDSLGVKTEITSNLQVVRRAQAAVLPGVGAFGDAMANLNKFKLTAAINELIESGRPFMGVCLGLQLLFDKSYEFGEHRGLGIIPGVVKKFTVKPVPQIAWNQIAYNQSTQSNWKSSPLRSLKNNHYFYFVHSYYVIPKNNQVICCETNYQGFDYCSGIIKNNIFAVQFHPEKSGPKGIEIYKNWLNARI